MITFEPALSVFTPPKGRATLRAAFHSIKSAIEITKNYRSPIFIFGDNNAEEIFSHRTTFSTNMSFDLPILDRKGNSFQSLIKRSYYGRTATLAKVASFMNGYGKQFFQIGDIEIDGICLISDASFEEDISRKYIISRRKKDRALHEIGEYLNLCSKETPQGPIILTVGGGGNFISFQSMLAIRKWHHSGRHYPLVITTTHAKDSRTHQFHSKSIEKNDVLEIVSRHFSISSRDASQHYSYWHASQRFRAPKPDDRMKPSAASQFFSFVGNVISENIINRPTIMLEQRPAPLMFSNEKFSIGLEHTPLEGTATSHVRGAARALIHQASDLMALPMLDNAAPRSSVRITRITSILERIYASNQPDESDLVEFGVEFSALETTLHQAQPRIGDISLGDIVSFLGEGRRFLSRFEIWNEYEADAKDQDESAEAASIAIEILQSRSASLSLSTEAKARLDESIEGSNLNIEEETTREGASRVAENLAAAAGKAAIDYSKSIANETVDDLKGKVSKKLSDSASAFIVENAPKLGQLAQARGAKWLELLIKWFDSQQ